MNINFMRHAINQFPLVCFQNIKKQSVGVVAFANGLQTLMVIKFKHEHPGLCLIIPEKNLRVCVFVRACVCKRNLLPYSEISVIPVQLSLEINFLKQKQDKPNLNTSLSQCSGLGKTLLLLVSWQSQEEYAEATYISQS